MRVVFWSVTTLALCACSSGSAGVDPAKPGAGASSTLSARAASPPAALGDEAIRARLLEIAKRYPTYARVSGQPSWAPTDCVAPMTDPPWLSASKDEGTHGQKLYFIFTTDAPGYVFLRNRSGVMSDVGRALVKESHAPVPVADGGSAKEVAEKDGRRYEAGAVIGLFIMYKVDPRTPGTDAGWVYGSTSADGSRVLAHGDVAACAGCHRAAPNDRLFGPS